MKALPLTFSSVLLSCLALAMALASAPCRADDALTQVIARVKPSIVGVGSLQKTRTPPLNFIGTGFVAGDGLSVLTCAHVIQKLLDANPDEVIGILTGQGEAAQFRPAKVQVLDTEHDLALLRLAVAPLPALALGDAATVREVQSMA